MPLMTLQEYLNLADWTFKLPLEEGCSGRFYWLESRNPLIIESTAAGFPPDIFGRILAIDTRRFSPSPAGIEGWKDLGRAYLSEAQ